MPSTLTPEMPTAWGRQDISSMTPERTPGNFSHPGHKVSLAGSPLKWLYTAADSRGVNRKNWSCAHTFRVITSLDHWSMVGQCLWSVRMEGWKVVQFSFLLKREKNYFSFFQKMSQPKTTILTFFHSFSSHKWQKEEIKHKNQKTRAGFRSDENHEWITCYFTWGFPQLHLYTWPESGFLCFLYSLWGILSSVRSCVF